VIGRCLLRLPLLLDVDWSSLFKSFYKKVRLKVVVRDPKKIPHERLFELDKKLYMISISVEGLDEVADEKSGDDSDDLDDKGGEDNFDDIDDLDDTTENMDTDGKSNNDGLGRGCGTPKSEGIGNRNIKSVVVECSDEGSDKQSPDVISHLYEIGGGENGAEGVLVVGAKTLVDVIQLNEAEDNGNEDNEQLLRWKMLLESKFPQEKMDELHLLESMGLIEDEMGFCQEQEENSSQLEADVVANLDTTRSLGREMKPCVYKRKMKKNKWGPVLVERQRRKQNDGVAMLQRAMNLKKKKEP
jgi:hypothetical protein